MILLITQLKLKIELLLGHFNIHQVTEKLKFRLQGIKIVKSCVEFLRNVLGPDGTWNNMEQRWKNTDREQPKDFEKSYFMGHSYHMVRFRVFAVRSERLTAQGSPGFAPGSIHVGFVVEEVILGKVSLRVLRLFPVSIIPHSFSILVSSGG
jgi:hypothetical protein